MMEQKKLTLEERIARAARSQAASPEAAAGLVQRLAQLHTVHIFHGNADLERMYELIGPYMDRVGDDVLYYAGFCRSIHLAFTDGAPLRPVLGTRTGNAVVLLGLMLLDHAKGRGWDKEVYRCTRMTLGQYLDALETVAFPEDGDAGRKFRRWREEFLKFYVPSVPLADVLADLLRLYVHGWKKLDYLDHILRCMEGLSNYLEEERTADLDREFRQAMRQAVSEMGTSHVEVVEEEREPYSDPGEHYFNRAVTYFWDVPDPAGEGISAGDVRDQIFLPDRDYSPQAVEKLAQQAPTPAFRALLERFLSERRLSSAVSEVNSAVSNLFMLWVGPYLWMGKRPQ